MPTKSVSFLQLGDVHYPDLHKARLLVDHKDKGMSAAMVGAISSSRIADITRGLARVRQEEEQIVAIAMTGDLTTAGDVSGYEACLNFLNGALQLSDHAYWQNRRLLVVPGNHDINRTSIVAGQPLLDKFTPLLDVWMKIFGNANSLTVTAPTPTDLPPATHISSIPSIRFLPLNTCYLCGEYRTFPNEIRQNMLDLLTELRKTISPVEFERILSEQVDCPAVDREHVVALEQHISANDTASISVVVGHHPLFAQPMPRVAAYTELLNAGYVREAVLGTRRNVIYLHGHIHQDPLLLLNSPLRGTHRIIHISAPALQDGFNLIRIFFSNVTSQPLGLELIRYRFGDHLGLEKLEPIKIRLADQSALWNEIDQPWTKYVLRRLHSPQTLARFNDLLKTPPKALIDGMSLEQQTMSVKNALLFLEILEMVEITNREAAVTLWQCRRRSA